MKLGIFDSGIGGEAVAAALRTTFPDADIITVNDHEHVPYGDKAPEEVTRLTEATIQPLLEAHCDIIIIACNTATALTIKPLRRKYPNQKFIGIEPMVKTAAEVTVAKKIAICATPAMLKSTRYSELIERFAADLTILEPDCSK